MRRVAFSASNVHDFVSKDAVFMEKISKALTTIHETYGYRAVQDCMQVNEATGDADVDLDVLCAMLDRSQAKLKSECCAMFFQSKSIIGSFMYLFGSLLFGAVTYFNSSLSLGIKAFCGICATSFYLFGGILFIVAAIEPYWKKTVEINGVAKEVNALKTRGEIVKQMSGKRASDNCIKARMSRLNIDTKSLLQPSEIEQLQMQRKQQKQLLKKQRTLSMGDGVSDSSSSDIFETIAEEQTTISPVMQQIDPEIEKQQQDQFELAI
eukprot:458704_1